GPSEAISFMCPDEFSRARGLVVIVSSFHQTKAASSYGMTRKTIQCVEEIRKVMMDDFTLFPPSFRHPSAILPTSMLSMSLLVIRIRCEEGVYRKTGRTSIEEAHTRWKDEYRRAKSSSSQSNRSNGSQR